LKPVRKILSSLMSNQVRTGSTLEHSSYQLFGIFDSTSMSTSPAASLSMSSATTTAGLRARTDASPFPLSRGAATGLSERSG
jgi:hypothetical protein